MGSLVGEAGRESYRRTRGAILWSSLLSEPLFTLYVMLAFILRKDLDATAFQIALLTMLKPVVSVFSFYWSAGVARKKLRWNVASAGFLARLPFLFFPFVDNVWFLIGGAVVHMFFYRAGNPAWVEILNLNLPKKAREKFFSIGSALGYAEGVLIAIAFGALLDYDHQIWKLLFFGSALVGMCGVFIQMKVPIEGEDEVEAAVKEDKVSFYKRLIDPWKSSYKIMSTRPDFAKFQWGFMACGFGNMLIQPALPLFFVDVLHLTYIDLAIALSICKGLGFVFSSPLWAKAMGRFSIAHLSCAVFAATGLFPLFLILAPFSLFWLYLAYVMYGIAQGGSHLIWNLSGPIFSGKEDSSLYSGVNIVMVGIRGAVAPPLGSLLCVFLGPLIVLGVGIGLCFYGGWRMVSKSIFQKV
jgi:hypothetical protein